MPFNPADYPIQDDTPPPGVYAPRESVTVQSTGSNPPILNFIYPPGMGEPRRDRRDDGYDHGGRERSLTVSQSAVGADTPLTTLGRIRHSGVYMVTAQLQVTTVDAGSPTLELAINTSPAFGLGSTPQTLSQTLTTVGTQTLSPVFQYLPEGSEITYSLLSGWTYVAAKYGYSITVVRVG